jgi:hypothetical protein
MRLLLAATMLLSFAGTCLAMETAATTPAAHATTAHSSDPHPCPTISPDASFARPMVIAIIALFVAAAAVGIVIRSEAPEVLPATHSHDEPAGSTHHAPHH